MHKLSTIALLGLVLILWGCGPDKSGPDITGGVEISLHRREGNALAYYDLEPDGTLSYAGGREALAGNTTWTGTLTREQADSVLGLVRKAGLFDRPPESGPKGEPIWIVKLKWPQGKQSFKAYGLQPSLVPIFERFDELAKARFVDQLDALPRPGDKRN